MKRIFIILSVLVGLVEPVYAATYYVSQSGNDANSCATATTTTQGNNKLTIAAGVTCLSAGDFLYIRSGTYTGGDNRIDSQSYTVPSGSSGNPITISAYTSETVVIQPPDHSSCVRLTTGAPAYLTFLNFTCDMVNETHSGSGGGADGVYLSSGANHNIFQGLKIKNGGANGIQFSDTGANSPFNEVRECEIHTNGQAAGVNNGYGMYIFSSDGTFYKNKIYNNGGYGAHFYNNSGPKNVARNVIDSNRFYNNGSHGGTNYGLAVAWGDGNVVKNNFIYGNRGGILIYSGSTNTAVSHNTIYGNLSFECIAMQFYDDGPVVKNNICYNNGAGIVDNSGTGTPVVTPNITSNPSFINAAGGDFSITTASTAYNAVACLGTVTIDFAGTARPQSSSCDAGAYEVIASVMTYYASPLGSDANLCSQATSTTQTEQKRTVAAAVACASIPGDTVLLHGGTYTGSNAVIDDQGHTVVSGSSFGVAITIAPVGTEVVILQPPYNTNAIRLYGSGRQYVIIQNLILDMVNCTSGCTAEAVSISVADHIRLQNLDIKNGAGFGMSVTAATDIQLLNSKIHDFGSATSPADAGYCIYWTASDSLIDANEVYNCGGYGMYIHNTTGAHTQASDNIIRNNRIYNAGMTTLTTAYGLVIGWGDDNLVYNNIIYNNQNGVRLFTDLTDTTIANNTIYLNRGNGLNYLNYNTGNIARNNIVYYNGAGCFNFCTNIVDSGTTHGTTVTASNNLTTDPTFTNATGGDFSIQSFSAAKDTGTTVAAVTVDILGAIRPAYTAYDIGAYEYTGSFSVPPATGMFISDTFTDTNGTALISHTGELGATWTVSYGVGGAEISDIGSAFAGGVTSGFMAYVASGIPTGADYRVDGEVVQLSNTAFIGVSGRAAASASAAGYSCYYGNGVIALLALYSDSTSVELGTYSVDVGIGYYPIRLFMSGTTIQCWYAGTPVITVTDSTYTATGRAGMWTYFDPVTDTTGNHLTSFTGSYGISKTCTAATTGAGVC